MTKTITALKDSITDTVLPLNRDTALRELIDISRKLCELSDVEYEKLVEDDFVGIALLQDRKQALSATYAQASREFHARLEEFRDAPQSLLKQLEILQKTLGDKARTNATMLEDVIEKHQHNTHTTLLSAQTIAQESR